ncbi:hypothetical protein M2650_15090 [Luteimonas sp. SX5]|uniref:Uncharacterized protein n=1 Tax=Luteimonas galliterrae TaxID=2940486 RepID=A0ABT0MM51_9GAMM|nr:hypothetical protein [Luteimonas galliterrae]MCL1635947.1 hypothetical protein [Luteimonas galliterrae]
MAASAWHEDNTITEVDLARQAKLGAVTEMSIVQTPQGYQVVVGLKWHPERVVMRTRRSTTEPRLFKSLERLVAHIRERYPAVRQVRIELMTAIEPAKPARKKAAR